MLTRTTTNPPGVRPRPVDKVMSRPVETVAPDTSLRAAATTMIERDVGALPVVDGDGDLVGLLTATDLVALVADGTVHDRVTAGDVARTDVVTTAPDALAADAAATMVDHLIHHLPVAAEGSLVGMVSSLDLAAAVARAR